MARRVDDHIIPLGCGELDAGGVDGNALLLFFLEGIQEIGILKGLARVMGDFLHLGDGSLGQGIRIVEQPANDRGLAVIHMAHHHDIQACFFMFQFFAHYIYPSFRSFCIA